MSRQRQAVRAYEAFKGEKPTRLRRARLPDGDVTGWQMGPLVGVAYEARRDGKTAQYFHEFKPKARPNLVAQDDGRRLYIEGGRFRVTDRGIEDMPNLFVVNPSPRSGKNPKRKGTTMRRARSRRRRSHVSVFTSNPRRRKRSTARRASRRVYTRNPARRRRRAAASTARRRVYRRNPARRMSTRRRFRRNPSGGGAMRLGQMAMPAVFIGLGALGTEIIQGYLPLPIAWKTGPMRYVVKGAIGVGIGLVLAKGFKQKRLGYYFAAGAIAIAVHDFAKTLVASSWPGVKGLGYVNPATVARFGQYTRRMPSVFGQYYPQRMPSVFGGDTPRPNARQPGGEMNFSA